VTVLEIVGCEWHYTLEWSKPEMMMMMMMMMMILSDANLPTLARPPVCERGNIYGEVDRPLSPRSID